MQNPEYLLYYLVVSLMTNNRLHVVLQVMKLNEALKYDGQHIPTGDISFDLCEW